MSRMSSKNPFISHRMAARSRIHTSAMSPSCFLSDDNKFLSKRDFFSLESPIPLRLRGGGLQRAWPSSTGTFRSGKKRSDHRRGQSVCSTGSEPLPEDATAVAAGQLSSSSWANIVAGNSNVLSNTASASGNAGIAKDEDRNYTNGEGDAYYFNSYSHFGIHEEMLKDEVSGTETRDLSSFHRHPRCDSSVDMLTRLRLLSLPRRLNRSEPAPIAMLC